jgi:microcin C transport system permease protein
MSRRRLAVFRANRRGVWSLRLFLLLLAVSLPAGFVANDRPLAVKAAGRWFFPVLQPVPETALGGVFATPAEFRDPHVAEDLVAARGGRIWWPPVPYGHDTVDLESESPAPAPPSRRHWLGTDDQGRDVLARAIHGLRLSILFGFTLTVLSSVVGVLLGLWQGYAGGWIDLVAQRFMELWGAMPRLYILIIMSTVIEPSFATLLGILLLFSWMSLVHVVRAETLRARNLDYVRAARALGLSGLRTALRHVLPNAVVAAMTYLPFILAGSLTTLTSLDFLGLGLPPGSPSLGEMLQQGKANLHAPWLGLTAFAVLAVLFTLVVFIGEAVRDAFDPRKSAGRVSP